MELDRLARLRCPACRGERYKLRVTNVRVLGTVRIRTYIEVECPRCHATGEPYTLDDLALSLVLDRQHREATGRDKK